MFRRKSNQPSPYDATLRELTRAEAYRRTEIASDQHDELRLIREALEGLRGDLLRVVPPKYPAVGDLPAEPSQAPVHE